MRSWMVVVMLCCVLTGCPPSSGEDPLPTAPFRAVEWERLQAPSTCNDVQRTRVPGGWLVFFDSYAGGCGTIFVADQGGEWLPPAPESAR